MPERSLVLLAGPSGSGKSRAARVSGAARLRLDDFYHDADHPDLPQWGGIVDWDDPATWDADAAMEAIRRLLRDGVATVPRYDISLSARTGEAEVRMDDRPVLVAEGIFAPELVGRCLGEGLPVTAIWLDRPRLTTFWFRLKRDLKGHRKPPLVLVRRGVTLARQEPKIRAHAVECGCRPLGLSRAVDEIRGLPGRRPA
jgi:uridine kinase